MRRKTPKVRVERGRIVLNGTAAPARTFTQITINLQGPKIRWEVLEGKKHMVVPMVMLTEGVHAGSQGPLYYPPDELGKRPEVWNHKPIVVYHPEGSACDPDVLNNRKIGVILNTTFSSKLAAEAWLDPDRVKEVDARILEKLEKGEIIEVSTGLWTENEEVEGEWNGEPYVAIARNYAPDHLAVLPDKTGACSIEDGAGLLRNEVSYGQVCDLLCVALKVAYPDNYFYVEDVFSKFFVFRKESKLFKQNYTTTDTMATLVGEPVPVVKVIQYRLTDGTVVANREETNVKKAQMIALLLANSGGVWTDADKPWLEAQTEERLTQLTKNMKAEEKEDKKDPATPPAPEPKPVANKAEEPKAPAPVSAEQYIANAPPEIRDMLATGLRTHEQEKNKLVAVITANAKNIFTADQLNAKSLEELKAIAQLAQNEAPKPALGTFAGLADAFSRNAGQQVTEEPLGLPAMTYEGAGK